MRRTAHRPRLAGPTAASVGYLLLWDWARELSPLLAAPVPLLFALACLWLGARRRSRAAAAGWAASASARRWAPAFFPPLAGLALIGVLVLVDADLWVQGVASVCVVALVAPLSAVLDGRRRAAVLDRVRAASEPGTRLADEPGALDLWLDQFPRLEIAAALSTVREVSRQRLPGLVGADDATVTIAVGELVRRGGVTAPWLPFVPADDPWLQASPGLQEAFARHLAALREAADDTGS